MRRPRVLSISHSYVVALNRAMPNALACRGWDVTIAAPPVFPGDLRPLTLERDLGEPAPLVSIPLHARQWPHLMIWGRDLRRLLAEDWDIVHVWEEPYVAAGAQVARWRTGGRLVFATFQNIPKRYPPPFNWIERHAMSRADAWIAFGVTIERALQLRASYRDLPHRVIPPAIDLDRFAPDAAVRDVVRGELGFSPRDVVFGFAGRFVPAKGLSTLTAALDEARENWRALFVGGGPLAAELDRWAARHPGRVRIIGDATHARMPRYLNAMDVLAVPSHDTPEWREQFGRVIVEAMACGVAVVGSDSGEIPHVIADAGIVLPQRARSHWARTIDAMIVDAERRHEVAARGLARARDFSADTAAVAHAKFFEELLAPA